MEKKGPQTEINFAPTEAFVQRYGKEEAEKERKNFERATWTAPAAEPADEPLNWVIAIVIIGTAVGVGILIGMSLSMLKAQ